MYSFPNLEPVNCSLSCSNYCFLTCIQISQEAGQVVWYSHLLKNFPQFVVIHTAKGFGRVNKADVFLELSCFFDDATYVGNLISGSCAFSKYSLNILKFSAHCRSLAWRFLNIILLECEMSASLTILWHCLSLGLENENRPFPVLWLTPQCSPGLNTGVGSPSLLQGVFPTQE